MINPIYLFEHGTPQELGLSKEEINSFDKFLNDVWKNREVSENWYQNDNKESPSIQDFVKINRDIKDEKKLYIKSNNYVGVIQWKGTTINLLPKIFDCGVEINKILDSKINAINTHVLWWLSYSSKYKFLNLKTNVNKGPRDFLEAMIYIFAKRTAEIFTLSTFQSFEDIESELRFMKGNLDFKKYISTNFSKGRQHILNCRYNSVEIDNKFNRIVKFVCKILLLQTKVKESKKYLSDIIVVLNEVGDEYFLESDCESIQFNSFFSHMKIILDYCKFFLSGSIINRNSKKLEVFAFLINMNMLFENFVYGFIKKQFDDIVKINPSETKDYDKDTLHSYLIKDKKNSPKYKLKPDGIIKVDKSKEFITDTKYKDLIKDDIKQSDLYQMLAYATRFNIQDVIIFYPTFLKYKKFEEVSKSYIMIDKLAGGSGKEISIRAEQLNIINDDWEDLEKNEKLSLSNCFKQTEENLKSKLIEIFKPS